jgi:hypothetical protein
MENAIEGDGDRALEPLFVDVLGQIADRAGRFRKTRTGWVHAIIDDDHQSRPGLGDEVFQLLKIVATLISWIASSIDAAKRSCPWPRHSRRIWPRAVRHMGFSSTTNDMPDLNSASLPPNSPGR